jgi:hypothetical protein
VETDTFLASRSRVSIESLDRDHVETNRDPQA